MNLYDIYLTLSEGYTVDEYIKISNHEVLLVPVLIEELSNGDYNQRMRVCSILDAISIYYPRRISPFAEYLISAADKFDDFAQWRVLKIVTNIIEYIPEYAEGVAELFIKAFNSCNIGRFSIACDCMLKISDEYPSIVELFKISVSNIEQRGFKIGNIESGESKFVASEKVKSVFKALEEKCKE